MTPISIGRQYAAFLHGDDSDIPFSPDLDLAREWEAVYTDTAAAVRENRAFVERVTAYAARAGYRQFVDIGAGPPLQLQPSVHAIAAGIRGDARTVYVDNDPTVTIQTLALDARGPHVTAIDGDVTKPGAIFGSRELRNVIDLAEPVAVLLCAVLHFVTPDEAMEALYGIHTDAMDRPGITDLITPGSLVALSVGCASPEVVAAYSKMMGVQGYVHGPTHVASYLAGLDPVERGMVWARDWCPDEPVRDQSPRYMIAGAGRTRER